MTLISYQVSRKDTDGRVRRFCQKSETATLARLTRVCAAPSGASPSAGAAAPDSDPRGARKRCRKRFLRPQRMACLRRRAFAVLLCGARAAALAKSVFARRWLDTDRGRRCTDVENTPVDPIRVLARERDRRIILRNCAQERATQLCVRADQCLHRRAICGTCGSNKICVIRHVWIRI